MSIPAKEMVAYVEALLAQPKQHCPIVGLQGEDHVRDLIAALKSLRAFMQAEGYADQTPEMAKADDALAKEGR